MKQYQDVFESEIDITEFVGEESRQDGVLAVLEFPFGVSGKMNLNKRYYPDMVWKDAVEGLNNKIQASFVPGTAGHPIGTGGTPLKDVSHVLTKVWVDENKRGWAVATVLDTTAGRNTMTVLKSGTKKIGASLRGYGEVGSDGAVKKGLELKTIDLVIDPSFAQDATITPTNIIESTILGEEKEQGEVGTLSLTEKHMAGVYQNPPKGWGEEAIGRTKAEGQFFTEYIMSGGKLSFKNWKKEREG